MAFSHSDLFPKVARPPLMDARHRFAGSVTGVDGPPNAAGECSFRRVIRSFAAVVGVAGTSPHPCDERRYTRDNRYSRDTRDTCDTYFRQSGDEIVLLLCGGTKKTQQRDIVRTHEMMREIRDGS